MTPESKGSAATTRSAGGRGTGGCLPRVAFGVVLPLALYASSFAAIARADVPLELRGRRVTEVVVAGETAGVTPSRDVGIPLGAPVSRRLLRGAVERLVASGLWADVQLDLVPAAHGVRVVAHLVPRLTLARVDIRGNDVFGDEDIERRIGLNSGSEIRRGSLDTIRHTIEAAYAERGYRHTRAHTLLRDTDDPARKVLIVEIDEGAPTRITAIHFEGTAPPDASDGVSAMDLAVGDVYDVRHVADAVRAGAERMRKRGWLEADLGPAEARPLPGGVALYVPSTPGPRYEAVLRGYGPLTRDEVTDALKLGSERLSGTAAIEGIRTRVLDLYQRYGFHDARVTIARAPGPKPGTARLLVTIAPRQKLDVVAVSFPGATHFETSFLRDQVFSYLQEDLPGSSILEPVDTETVKLLGFGGERWHGREVPRPLDVDPRHVYYEPTYHAAVQHVRELYQAAGYLAVRVGPAQLHRIGGGRALVSVPVVEGPRSMLYDVRLEGNHAIGARAILEATELRRGMPFSHLALEQARIHVLDLYREQGRIYARVEPHVRFSGDRTRAEVTFQIVESYPVHVGRIVVHGATRTSESLIRDLLELSRGDLFRPSLARESQERLSELGIFRGVTVSPEDASLPARVKAVVVTVTERSTQFLDFTAGLSTGEGLRGGIEYGYRNLFGWAIGFHMRAEFAYQFFFVDSVVADRLQKLSLGDRLERRVTMGLTVPHIPGLRATRGSLDLVHLRDNERDFGYDKNGVDLTVTWHPLRPLTASISEDFENNDIQLFVAEDLSQLLKNTTDPRLQRLLRVPQGASTLLATRGSVSLDMRDNPFTPTKGFYASMTAEWARTLTTQAMSSADMMSMSQFHSNHLKLSFTASGYVPVVEHVVLAGQLRLGRIVHLDPTSRTYPNRSFFLGGVDTMRGYLQDALIPQDLANEIAANPDLGPNDAVHGGDAFVLLRVELRFPIVGPLQGGVFGDFGNLWASTDELKLADVFDLRPTAGLGLRIATPVGPIAFDYGFILLRRAILNEPVGAFHFSIGLF